MSNNFKDEKTGEEFFITNFLIVPKGSGTFIYKDKKTQKQLTNPANGNILVPIVEKFEIGVPMILKGNNKQQLNKMLRERSHNHYKKEIEESKHEKMKKLRNDHYN